MNLPQDFLQMMESQLGKEQTQLLENAISMTSPTSIRINTNKICEDTTDSVLSQVGEKVKWCDTGYYLDERPSFTFDPLFHTGAYYVQEASSMYLNQIIKTYIDKKIIALDMCAAPGGKSTLALSAMPEGSLLIANEVVRQRCQILSENITKWGNPNVIVTNNYAEDFEPMGQVFDLIICDAPCSGEGMFRKDQGAIDDWSLNNVDICWHRQREIIEHIWQCLKPGGILVYSTCTYNHFEDEDIVQWMEEELGAEKLPLCDKAEWNITNGHFFPHKTKGEGFFICPMRKKDDDEAEIVNTNRKKSKNGNNGNALSPIRKNTPAAKEVNEYIKNPENFFMYENKDSYYAFPAEHLQILESAIKNLKVVHSGIKLATVKGKGLQPDHSLAMSTSINESNFDSVELTKDEAIAYLRTEAITVNAPKGYILLKYKGIPLGFGKNIGNRVNNLYPTEWKIRKNY
ncbi:MAG: rRNA cytosine-C5-methyltransferase [Bacteroidaceae bacterium]|nr:rRNA cytosine-C5-methyltransferase [Bacteroidaceae bacterium]